MNTQRKTGRALLAGLFGAALALVAGSAAAVEIYPCSMGGGTLAGLLTVYGNPVTGVRTCTRTLVRPRTNAVVATPSCHVVARQVGCLILN
jgi:hypothetical protein